MRFKTVTVTLPERVWGHLASIADIQGVRVSDVLAHAIAAELKRSPRAPFDADYVSTFDSPLDELQYELREAARSGWRVPRRGKAS